MSSRFCTIFFVLFRLLSFSSTPPHSVAVATITVADASQSDHMSSPTPSDRPMHNVVDPESGELDTDATNLNNNDDPQDWKRTGKVVQTVGLGGVGVSVTLIVNAPPSAATHVVLYTAYLSVVGLGLFTGMGLSFFSILMKGSPSVGWVQIRLMFFTLFFMAIACLLRLHLALPLADVMFGAISVLVVVGIMVIYLYIGWRWKLRRLTQA
ncbi:hypothetical protein KSP40_PGU015385 [Platanthera guangdongensis]|uniref:Uncharacterized protein n=1 Tax=Platanthera guangdongensis TaxID=2320717 RepID=A0ABR2N074_9ASPA